MCPGRQRDTTYDTPAESKRHSNDLEEKGAKKITYFYC